MSNPHAEAGGHHGESGKKNTMGEILFGYCEQVKGGAHGIMGMVHTAFMGIFGGSGGGAGHDHHH